MNSYYTVRIELQKLDKSNDKLEYRALYRELKKKGFRDYFFNSENIEFELPNGMYAILKYDFPPSTILSNAQTAIENALTPFYESGWVDKFTLLVGGPGQIYSRNLTPK